jgi:hypothetical protein
VLAHYDVRDAILDVHIFDLDREPSPVQFSRLSPARGYALNVVIYVADPAQLVGTWGRPSSARGVEKDGTFDEYVADVARKLRLYADDLLSGDFSRASRLETALQRMREAASNASRSQSTSAPRSYDVACFRILAEEFGEDSKVTRAKIRRKLRTLNEGPYDETRVLQLRALRDKLWEEIKRFADSEYYVGPTQSLASFDDFDCDRIAHDYAPHFPGVSQVDLRTMVSYAIYLYYLR